MVQRLLTLVEQTPLSLFGFISAFAAIVLIRALIESFSSGSGSGFLSLDPSTLVHYALYFLCAYLVVALILGTASRNYAAAAKVSLFCMTAIWLPPIVDLVLSRGAGVPMSYLIHAPTELFTAFFSFANPFISIGPTLGQKFAILGLLAFIVWYARGKGKTILATIFLALTAYTVLFLLGAFPSLLYMGALLFGATDTSVMAFLSEVIQGSTLKNAAFPALSAPPSATALLENGFNILIASAFSILAALCGLVFLFLLSSHTFLSHARNFRPLRVLHFLVLVVAGATLAYFSGATIHPIDLFPFFSLLIAWCAACYFAVATNDIEDEAIDVVSSPHRPLPAGTISRKAMQDASTLSFVSMLLAGFSAGYYPFFFLLSFTAAYYAYSASPLRLKRVPILSSLLIGFAALSAVCAGFFLLSPDRSFGAFPFLPAAGIVVFYTLFSHFRDLKDIPGDTAAGIPTVAALLAKRFGERVAFHSVGALVAVAFLSTPLFFQHTGLLFPAVAAACAGYAVCVQRPYIERRLFFVFFIFLLFATFLALR